jgi:23S rRNA (cytosine1962-C5)-methyltransferase
VKTLHLRVPSPALPDRLDRFLAAQVPELSRRAARGLLDAGQVRVDDRLERASGRRLRPGERVELRYRPGRLAPAQLAEGDVVARGDGWLGIHKPSGLPTHRADDGQIGVPERLAECLGGESSDYRPAHRLDRGTSGALLVALDDAASARLSRAFEEREVTKEYRAVVGPPPQSDEGEEQGDGMHLRWAVLRRSSDGRRAELAVWPTEGRTHQVRRQLAGAGTPIVGDVDHGVCLPGGAPRMALHCASLRLEGVDVSCDPPAGWDELLTPTARPERVVPAPRVGLPSLRVSGATARVLRGGHPWVVHDRDTGPMDRLRPGQLVQLVDPRGADVAVAVADPSSSICARVLRGDASFAARVRTALKKRRSIVFDGQTDALRLIHAEADGLPGLFVDRWGDILVATLACEAARTYAPEVYSALRQELDIAGLWEQDHLTDLRKQGAPRDASLAGRVVFGAVPEERFEVRERGLRFGVEPRAGLTTGLYSDQRDNRDRVASLAEGAVVANLFAHTGAFSVALAAAGAKQVFAVDLGQRYLRWTAENLERNGLDPASHPGIAADAIDWLQQDAPSLNGAILDPPSHARRRGRGTRDWNAKRDYAELVASAAAKMEPGGWLLCCVNSKGVRRNWLPAKVREGCKKAGRGIASTDVAGPAADHPRLKGFPEGVAFNGLLARLE